MVLICFKPRKVSKSAQQFLAAAFNAPWRFGRVFIFFAS